MSETGTLMDAPETDTGTLAPYIEDAARAAAEWQLTEQDQRLAGRYTKFTPQAIVKLLTAVREGMHYEPACALAGISYQTLRNWLNRAEDDGPDSPHGRVACALKLAEAEAEGETVRYVRAASRDPRFWAAGMTFLERRHPDRWRRPDAGQQVQVQVGIALGVQLDEGQRRAMLPTVTIAQIAKDNGTLPQAGDTPAQFGAGGTHTQTFALDASLSPVPRKD